ncbi:sensor histidine kinase [Paenibacillus sp. DXFW5]|uniref:histidine kinase n=1 Tax=Paenibacillus rhizolycopersici TaxID=2780073 RepID=A0ABS2GZW9_9BACL|nr:MULTISPECIES: sensor histidine kinase [Paenibacillus]MBM6994477.1 sensor histidine kinase [Paenibacillus rhizolycopersici]MDU2241198.1 sensor histidine kinase [Paenibacillus sp.]MUG87926.1 HAMP domain-containing protein [Paenibacillus timonensis]
MRNGFHSINHRLFLLFLFCMSGILLIVSLLYYNRTTEQYHEKISDLSQKNVAQTAGLFSLLYEGYDSLSKSITNNFEMIRLLNEKTDEPAIAYINEQSITNIIGAIFYSRDDLVGIHVITNRGKIYNYGNSMNVLDSDYPKEEWYHQLRDSSGKLVWLGVYAHSLIDMNEDSPVFAFGRQIYDLNEHKPIGIALFEVNPGPVLDALDNLKLGEHSEVYLMNQQGQVVSSLTEPAPVLPNLPKLEGSRNMVVEQKDSGITVASRLPFSDWSVVSVTPRQDLNVELVETKRYLLIVISILIIVSAVVASLVSRTIANPLKKLIREMKQVEIGNFRGMVNVSSYQEINILVASFNRMVSRIEELIERVKVSSVSEKNAELHALQSQVNPHFLYNTLDMIYWLLDEKENDRLGELVLSLSSMFRYSSEWKDGAKVTLREELEQIHHYLTIILIRLEGRLRVETSVDERWMGIRLPKMTVQPIIENAVKYGLESLKRQGVLKLYTQEVGDVLKIVVEDNGNGMNGERLAWLKQSLNRQIPRESGTGSSGIGLQNLHRRIQHMFGERYGLEIESIPDEGTKVAVVLPLPMEGDVS